MAKLRHFHVKRVREIISVFYDLGFDLWLKKMQLGVLVPMRKRIRIPFVKKRCVSCELKKEYKDELKDFPKNLRMAFERLGPTFIKFGQMLSLRPDIVGIEIATELRALQDDVSRFPASTAKAIIEKDLNKKTGELFKSFTDKPIGAASLAQVHKAKLKNGHVVAVKVLRPNVEKIIKEDIAILEWLAETIEKNLEEAAKYQPTRLVREFRDWTMRELNLLNEATNIEHFRAIFKDEKRVVAPEVVWSHSSRRVITMQYCHGIPIDDFKKYKKVKASRKSIAKLGMEIGLRQFFEFGFFHADPHPGNMIVLPGNRLCVHDFGIVGRLEDQTRREFIATYVAFVSEDGDGLMKHLLHLAKTTPTSNVESFKREGMSIFEQWFYSPTAGKRISQAFYEMISNGAKYGVVFPSNIFLLAKAIVTMESTTLLVDPKFDMAKSLKPYLNKLMTLEIKPSKIVKEARDAYLDSMNILENIPEAARNLLQMAKESEVGIRIDTTELMSIKKEIDRQTDIRILSLFLVADILATAVLLHLQGVKSLLGISLASLGIVAGILLSVVVLIKIRRSATDIV